MEEAIRLGTRIAVMDKGRLLQYATPQEIIARPATQFVHDLLGGGSDRVFRLLSLVTVDGLVEPVMQMAIQSQVICLCARRWGQAFGQAAPPCPCAATAQLSAV